MKKNKMRTVKSMVDQSARAVKAAMILEILN